MAGDAALRLPDSLWRLRLDRVLRVDRVLHTARTLALRFPMVFAGRPLLVSLDLFRGQFAAGLLSGARRRAIDCRCLVHQQFRHALARAHWPGGDFLFYSKADWPAII